MQTILLAMIPAAAMAVAMVAQAQENPMAIRKMTPNLFTDDVQACVRFWVDRLHFEKTMEVPEGSGLAFAALQKGSVEVMYGSYASLEKDAGAAQAYRRGTSFLFIEVEDLDAVFTAMNGVPIVTPVHKTFYGSTEFTVKDPAGHLITFAQFGKP
jgi:uncharacterized glyoxalase superfamily protein PhnB